MLPMILFAVLAARAADRRRLAQESVRSSGRPPNSKTISARSAPCSSSTTAGRSAPRWTGRHAAAEIRKRGTGHSGTWPPLLEKPTSQVQWKQERRRVTRLAAWRSKSPPAETAGIPAVPPGKGRSPRWWTSSTTPSRPAEGGQTEPERLRLPDGTRLRVAMHRAEPNRARPNADLYWPQLGPRRLQPLSYLGLRGGQRRMYGDSATSTRSGSASSGTRTAESGRCSPARSSDSSPPWRVRPRNRL